MAMPPIKKLTKVKVKSKGRSIFRKERHGGGNGAASPLPALRNGFVRVAACFSAF